MFIDINTMKTITSIGAGPIGGGWTAHFLAQGYNVNAYLHSENEIKAFKLKIYSVKVRRAGIIPI